MVYAKSLWTMARNLLFFVINVNLGSIQNVITQPLLIFNIFMVVMTHGFVLNVIAIILSFGKLNNQNFQSYMLSFTEASSDANRNKGNSTLSLKYPPNLSLLFNQFNDLSAESNRTYLGNVTSVEKSVQKSLMKYKKL